MAQWTFLITLSFILISALLSFFVSSRRKDKCIKSFHGHTVLLEMASGPSFEGILETECSGIELIYRSDKADNKKSYLLYKEEYSGIRRIARMCKTLTPAQKKRRDSNIGTDYYNRVRHSTWRKTKNIFNSFRDSFLDAMSLFIGRAKRGIATPGALQGQTKYIGKMKEDVIGHIGRAYDPLLEKHIGQKVVVIEKTADKQEEYRGILREYTPNFIEIMDIDIQPEVKADVIFPRATAVVRYTI